MGFCVKCGKKDIKGSLCKECFQEENPIMTEFKDMHVDICRNCNASLMRGRWYDNRSVKDAVETLARNMISKMGLKPKPKVSINFPKTVEEMKSERGKKHFEIVLSFPEEEYALPATLVFTECPRCSRQRSTYFEAILQLREPTDDMVEFVKRRVESKREKGIFVTAVKKLKNGFDFYITNKTYALHLGKLLQKHFFGIMKSSPQLFSQDRDTQKGIYRVNVLFKAFNTRKGDIIKIGEDSIKILEARGERVQGMNIKNKKKVFISPEEIK